MRATTFDCLLQSGVSWSFSGLTISDGPIEDCLSSRQDTASPTDTACSSESPAFLGPASHLLAYDQNSSEEELEVINGGAASSVDSETDGDGGGGGGGGGGSSGGSVIGVDCAGSVSVTGSSESVHRAGGGLLMSLADVVGGYQNACDDELDDCAEELCLATSSTAASAAGRLRPLTVTPTQLAAGGAPKRCSSNNLLEKRKRSLAHSSDDEVRHLLENQHQQHYHQPHHHPHQPPQLMSAPVNFRTSPPLEALKPHRGHIIQRSTTPLILTESGRGLEHIRISSSSSISSTTSSLSSLGGGGGAMYGVLGGGLPTCDSPATVNSSHHHHQHHHHHHQHHQTSNNLALLSTTTTGMGQDMAAVVTNNSMEISRSVSPPAKVFHCAVSPRRRQPSRQQRLQRPHRPCLDFDKMQQVSIYRFDAIPNSRLHKCVAI